MIWTKKNTTCLIVTNRIKQNIILGYNGYLIRFIFQLFVITCIVYSINGLTPIEERDRTYMGAI